MVFTPRFITLTLGGAVILFGLILGLGLNTLQAGVFLLIYNGLLALAFLVDWLATAQTRSLTVTRNYEHRLSLGAANPVTITIRNHSSSLLKVILKDEPPVEFKASQRQLQAELEPGAVKPLKYTLEPHKRGDYAFGFINIRYLSRLGLFQRQFRVTGENTAIRVYPNIMELRRFRLLAKEGHLLEMGVKSSRVVGLGTDFESIRDYQRDDEYKRINWSATARRGRLVTNQYEEDKSQNILLVLDAGRMMSGEVRGMSKLDYAINASLLLGYVGVNRDDKVGLLAFSDQVKLFIPPRKGQAQLQKILGTLYNLQPEIVESDYAAACQYLGIKNRKRSLVCIFTDLIDEEASKRLITYVSALTSNHLVVCVTMLDHDLINQAKQLPEESAEVYRKGVAQTVLRHREEAITRLKNRGVVVVNVPPEELSVAAINKYLELKSASRL